MCVFVCMCECVVQGGEEEEGSARGDECWPPIHPPPPSLFLRLPCTGGAARGAAGRAGDRDRQVYSIAAAVSLRLPPSPPSSSLPPSSSSSLPLPPLPWFECSSSANSASIFSLVESIPIMFGGEKLLQREVKGEREGG